MKNKSITGIDEVGRGPIAGPVTVCACTISPEIAKKYKGIKDSKKLSEKKREEIFFEIKDLVQYKVKSFSNKIIDEKGISFCLKKAVAECLKGKPLDSDIRLDGSLYAPKEYTNQKTIIKGDEKEVAIALASIIAKVTRDRFMVKMALKYPGYGFEEHKGYGTKGHYESIRRKGIIDIHRKSFLKDYDMIKK